MADNPVASGNVTQPAFRPDATAAQPHDATHGRKHTQNHQQFVTPIKIEFQIPSSQTTFKLNKAHQEILQIMKDKDPTLEIIPSKEGKAKFSDLLTFPANEQAYNELFDHAVVKQPTEARKIIVTHSLITSMKFSDLKFQNTKLMDHMFKNKIWIRYNQSQTLQVAALGFIQGVHPRVTHRDGFISKLQASIHLEMTEAERGQIETKLAPNKKQTTKEGDIQPDIKLEVNTRTIGYGNGDTRIKTEAFEIRVPIEIRLEIKEIMTRLGSKNLIPAGVFVPYGLAQTVGVEVYKKLLRMQNEYLTNFRIIPVFGITPQALQHVIQIEHNNTPLRSMTLQHFILSTSSVLGLETTNRAADLGKLFLISDASSIIEARCFVDTTLKELYESGVIPAELILPNFNPPRRGDAPRTTATFQSYASALAKLGNPQDDATPMGGTGPPPRPAKRNIHLVYDLQGDFPPLPQRTTQNPPITHPSAAPAPAPAQNHSNAETTPAITPDTLEKFREDMKKEFLSLIQKEVKTQIQEQISAMRSELVNLSTKIDSMQVDIRESIGATIRETIQASFNPAHTPPQQHPQNPSASAAAAQPQSG
jgi:hypothetical protein